MTEVNGRTRIVRDLSEQKHYEAMLADIAIAEQERIGRELHDSVGQDLAALALVADRARERYKGTPTEVTLNEIAVGIRKTIVDVRAAVRGLTWSATDSESLILTLEELAISVRRHNGIECELEADVSQHLSAVVAHNLYRIASEAVSNAVRHASPQKIEIWLGVEDGRLLLRVSDDGIGIPANTGTKGVGVWIMRKRAKTIEAECDIRRNGARGTVVRCVLGAAPPQGERGGVA